MIFLRSLKLFVPILILTLAFSVGAQTLQSIKLNSLGANLDCATVGQGSMFFVGNVLYFCDSNTGFGDPVLTGGSGASTISAALVTAGDFGSLAGGGDYSFSGNLGIGVTTPAAVLHVSGTGGANNPQVLLSNDGWYGSKTAAGTEIRMLGINSSNTVYMGAVENAGGNVVIREDGSDVITLSGSNVGIGTSTPSTKLHVYSSGAGPIATFTAGSGNAATFNQPITIGYPSVSTDAARKDYVDTNFAPIGGSAGVWINSGSFLYPSSTNWLVGVGATPTSSLKTTNTTSLTLSSGEGRLQVMNSSSATSSDSLILRRVSSPNTHSTGILFSDGNSLQAAIRAKRTNMASNYNSDLLFYTGDGTSDFQDESDVRMVITSAGNVGIGTTTPSNKLTVNGNIQLSGGGYIYGDTTTPSLRLSDANGTYLSYGTNQIYLTSTEIRFLPNGAQTGIFTTTGLGIGTTTPATKLHVVSASGNAATFNQPITIGYPSVSTDAARKDYVDTVAGIAQSASWVQSGSNLYPSSTSWNVGIGTTAPGAALNVVTSAATTGLIVKGGGNANVNIASFTDGVGNAPVVINPLGNVGIGTTGPGSKLSVVSGTVNSETFGDATDFISATTGVNDGTIFVQSNDDMAIDTGGSVALGGRYVTGTTRSTPWAKIFGGKATGVSTQYGGYLSLQTRTTGTSMAERMRIDTSGNVGIGTSTPSQKLHVTGNILAKWDGTNSGIYIKPGVTSTSTNKIGNGGNSNEEMAFYGAGNVSINIDSNDNGTNTFTVKHGAESGGTTTLSIDEDGDATFLGAVTAAYPSLATHLARKDYVDAAVLTATSSQYWTLSSSNLYPNSVSYNVAIGTSTPYGKLHVSGIGYSDQNTNVDTTTSPTTTTAGGVVLDGGYSDGRYRTRLVKIDRNGNLPLYIQDSYGTANLFYNVARFGSHTYSTNKFEVYGSAAVSGNLAIGTSTAQTYKLQAVGNGAIIGLDTSSTGYGRIYLGGTDAGIAGVINRITGNESLYFGEDSDTGSTRFRSSGVVTFNGNVGIGTTTPATALNVIGLVRSTDSSQAYNPPISSTDLTPKQYVDANFAPIGGAAGVWKLSGNNLYASSTSYSVGIGTNSPLAPLHIHGTSSLATSTQTLRLSAPANYTAGFGPKISFWNGNNEQLALITGSIQSDSNGNYGRLDFGTRTSDALGVQTKLSILANGNIGIGTTTPATNIEVRSTSAPTIRLGLTKTTGIVAENEIGTYEIYGSDNTANYVSAGKISVVHNITPVGLESFNPRMDFKLYDYNGGANSTLTKLSILNSGNVGIGTTTPSNNLHVIGTVRSSDSNGAYEAPISSTDLTPKQYVDDNFAPIGGTAGVWKLSGDNLYASSTSYSVGIGTTNPTAGVKLQIVGGSSTSTPNLSVDPSSGAIGSSSIASFNSRAAFGYDGSRVAVLISDKGTNKNIVFDTNNSERLRIDSSGNVGIGTTTPGAKLDIAESGDANKLGMLRVFNPGATTAGRYTSLMVGKSAANGGNGALGFVSDTATPANSFMYLANYGNSELTQSLVVKNGGNVGIGTTTPATELHINQIGTGAIFRASTGGVDSFSLNLNSDNSWTMWDYVGSTWNSGITQKSGNVGIGTTTPATALNVIGLVRSTDSSQAYTPPISSTDLTPKQYVDANFAPIGGAAGVWMLSGNNLYASSTSYSVGIGTASPTAKLDVYDNNLGVKIGTGPSGDNFWLQRPFEANSGYRRFVVGGNLWWDTTDDLWHFGSNGSNGFNAVISRSNDGIGFYTKTTTGTATGTISNATLDSTYSRMVITAAGNVGIGTTTPATALNVIGLVRSTDSSQAYTPPIASTDLTPKQYVDDLIGANPTANATSSGACNLDATCEMQNADLGGTGNITGVSKLTVTTIDPLYQIKGKKYSTYASAIVGGVKEEYVGRGEMKQMAKGKWQMILNFDQIKDGSDLWVWHHAVDFSENNVDVLVTPVGVPVPVAYEIKGNKIIFSAESINQKLSTINFSYRLIGKRVDWVNWPTLTKDQTEKAGIIVE